MDKDTEVGGLMSDVLKGLKLFENKVGLVARIDLLITEWKKAYPTVDIENQIQWAHCWLLSNPKNMKKDLIRFLNNWMKGEERRNLERRGVDRRAAALPPPQRYDVPEEEVMTGDDFKKMREAIRK
jgi:hypothetical protein